MSGDDVGSLSDPCRELATLFAPFGFTILAPS